MSTIKLVGTILFIAFATAAHAKSAITNSFETNQMTNHINKVDSIIELAARGQQLAKKEWKSLKDTDEAKETRKQLQHLTGKSARKNRFKNKDSKNTQVSDHVAKTGKMKRNKRKRAEETSLKDETVAANQK